MKTLIINGSHRTGNTSAFSNAAVELIKSIGQSAEIINLRECNLEYCTGCLECEATGECILNDDFNEKILPKLLECNAYIFASPVYFNMLPARMKNFIDRTNPLCGYFEENQKKVAIFLVGQADEESLASAEKCLLEYSQIMNFEIMGDSILKIARDIGELVIDDSIKEVVAEWFNL
jgi:multimeric flavodoxin WrbA